MLPLTLIRRKITNRTLRSFLYYVPYATLSAMTFPAILTATGSAISVPVGPETLGRMFNVLGETIDGGAEFRFWLPAEEESNT